METYNENQEIISIETIIDLLENELKPQYLNDVFTWIKIKKSLLSINKNIYIGNIHNKQMIENFFNSQDNLIQGYKQLIDDITEDWIGEFYPQLKNAMDNIIKSAEE